jgi:hypothetical protein
MSCFTVLKQMYRSLVQAQIQVEINHIEKDDFLQLYLQACNTTYRSSTIQAGFRVTGLVLLDLDQVLNQLYIQLCTLTPPLLITTTTTITA